MKLAEREVLRWALREGMSVQRLADLGGRDLQVWVKAHKGRAAHIDAVCEFSLIAQMARIDAEEVAFRAGANVLPMPRAKR